MRTAAFVLSALALVACDSGDSPPTFEPTSVPESKPVDELDENEQDAFCEEAIDWVDDVLGDDLPRLQCNAEAIVDAVAEDGSFDLAACKASRDACLASPDFEDPFEEQDLRCDFSEVTHCDATVGQFSTCFEEAAQRLDRAVEQTTCERFAAGDYPDESDLAVSPECIELFERCDGEPESEPPPPE